MFDEASGMVLGYGSAAPSTQALPSSITASAGARPSHASQFGQAPQSNDGLAEKFAAVFSRDPLRSISTAESFAELTRDTVRQRQPLSAHGTVEEHFLWRLTSSLLRDAERSAQYQPDAIGIAATHKNRRWYISQHAHIQDLLQRSQVLRVANLVLLWLEERYRATSPPAASVRRAQQSDSEHDALLLRRIITSKLRAGELAQALDAAESAKDAMYCCTLAASEMQTTRESWYTRTALVPLFGEYGKSEESYANNNHRLLNLSYLFEDSTREASADSSVTKLYDRLIAATLSGNDDGLLQHTVPQGLLDDGVVPLWQHKLWAILRGTLVTAFSKLLANGGATIPSMKYLQHLDERCRDDTAHDEASLDWAQSLGDQLVARVEQLVDPLLSDPNVSVEEQLQLRMIMQFFALCPGRHCDNTGRWLLQDIETVTKDYRGLVSQPSARVVASCLLCVDLSASEKLIRLPLQGTRLAHVVCWFLESLENPDWEQQTIASIVGVVRRFASPQLRALLYGSFVFALRVGALDRGVQGQSIEAQEHRAMALLRSADGCAEVHDELLRVLNDRASQESHRLLTDTAASEAVLWESMRVEDPAACLDVFRRACTLCLQLWRENSVRALADVVDILRRHLLVKLGVTVLSTSSGLGLSCKESLLSDDDSGQFAFWSAVLAVYNNHAEHACAAAEHKAAPNRTAAFTVQSREDSLRRGLLEGAQQILLHARSVLAVHSSATLIATCCAWAVRCYAEACVLVFALPYVDDVSALRLMQQVFALVEVFDRSSQLMERNSLPRHEAEALYTAIRTARAAYGQRKFQKTAEAIRLAGKRE